MQFFEIAIHRRGVQHEQPGRPSPWFPNVCAAPRGTSRKSPAPPVSPASSSRKVIVPSSTKNASEQAMCRCGGGVRAPGGTVRSISEKSPPVWSATALKAITFPRAVNR